MAINYDFYRTAGLFGAEEQWHVRLVENGTMETEDMMQYIEESTSLTLSDLKGALEAFVGQIVRHLGDGKNVHIEGLGHFSLSVGGEVVKNEEGALRLKHPAVRSVNFRPEPALLRKFSNVRFTSKSHRGRQSQSVDEAELPSILAALCAEKGHFTTHAFQKALKLTHSTAHRHLRRLCEAGTIENIGSRRFALYSLCQKL